MALRLVARKESLIERGRTPLEGVTRRSDIDALKVPGRAPATTPPRTQNTQYESATGKEHKGGAVTGRRETSVRTVRAISVSSLALSYALRAVLGLSAPSSEVVHSFFSAGFCDPSAVSRGPCFEPQIDDKWWWCRR